MNLTLPVDFSADCQVFAEPQPCAQRGILHVINGEHYAGAERVQDLLAEGLDDFGYSVGFACLKRGMFPQARRWIRSTIHELPMHGRMDLRPVWETVELCRREGYAAVHSHSSRTAMIACFASSVVGVPWIHHIHSPTVRDTTNRWQCWANALLERTILGRASALITVSESLKQYAKDCGFREDRITVVPNGVPCRRLPTRQPRAGAPWTLGMVALFRPRKGIEVLLESLADLRREGVVAKLRAVGSFETPQYEQQIRALTAELGLNDAVEWVGFTRDVDAELAKMNLLVLPSLFGEGMPMVVLEAMAAGLPVVATQVEGVPEVIRHGREGLIVPPGDAKALAAALRQIASGEVDWEDLHNSAIKRHAEHFSTASMAQGVAAVYDRVLLNTAIG